MIRPCSQARPSRAERLRHRGAHALDVRVGSGRPVAWRFPSPHLNLVPTAFQEANAYYSDDDQALLFGYFPTKDKRAVYTCLAHDIVADETTHAILDGLRSRFEAPGLPDQAGFHEGFADLVGLLSLLAAEESIASILGGTDKRVRASEVPIRRVATVRPADDRSRVRRRAAPQSRRRVAAIGRAATHQGVEGPNATGLGRSRTVVGRSSSQPSCRRSSASGPNGSRRSIRRGRWIGRGPLRRVRPRRSTSSRCPFEPSTTARRSSSSSRTSSPQCSHPMRRSFPTTSVGIGPPSKRALVPSASSQRWGHRLTRSARSDRPIAASRTPRFDRIPTRRSGSCGTTPDSSPLPRASTPMWTPCGHPCASVRMGSSSPSGSSTTSRS